jgi:hypothetical protein
MLVCTHPFVSTPLIRADPLPFWRIYIIRTCHSARSAKNRGRDYHRRQDCTRPAS